MDPNNAIGYRHRRSPSSDRFIGVFSPPSQSTANISSSAGDELNEIDVFYTSDFSSGSEPRTGRSGTADHRFRHSIRQPEKFGILAALPERDRKIDVIVQKPAVCSPPAASFARDIPAIPKPHSSSEAKYTQSMPGRRFQQSAPVNVPVMPRKARNEALAEVEEADEEEVLPPHEMVARVSLRNQKTTFSVLEGVGRTLKGRDLRQVRNAVWRQTEWLRLFCWIGAGIAGLTTSLALHRLGIRSLVLESADTLRTHGFAFALWANAWKALDALAIGDILRQQHKKLTRLVSTSVISGLPTAALAFEGDHEVRRINRQVLIETLRSELPERGIRYSSKVVHIEDSGFFKLVQLVDGTVVKTKVLIGCDGVNSVVAKYLGFGRPSVSTRASIRGYVECEGGHGFEPEFLQFFGNGVRFGVTPCDDHGVYWFFTYIPSPLDMGIEKDPSKMKQFVLSKLGNVSSKIKAVFEQTDQNSMIWSQLKFRHPWELLWGNISRDGVCVAGDALHPMTPDIGQGGCSALEDGVVLARVLSEALTQNSGGSMAELEHRRVVVGLEKFTEERRWRSIKLVAVAFLVGYVQQSNGIVISFLRDRVVARFLAGLLLKMSDFNYGGLSLNS